jgi:hypothetical protein
MDIQSIQMIILTLVFVIITSLIIYIIDKMNWWGGVKKQLFMWNIISAIFILLGTLVSLIFIVFTAMLFASGKD